MTNQKLEINPAPQVYIHKSSLLKSPVDMTPPIPHNRRADALLSTNTDLKPIPIHGTAGFKFHRNTRKPLNVASYTQNSYMNNRFNNTGSSGFNANYNSNSYNNNNNYNSKFDREDFSLQNQFSIIIWTNMENRNLVKQSAFADGYKSIHHLNDTKRELGRRIIITNVKRVINNNNMYTTASTLILPITIHIIIIAGKKV